MPPVDTTPATSNASLMVIGTPCNGGNDLEFCVNESASRADFNADFSVSTTTAFNLGLTFLILDI